jgi:hypothetical protein
MRLRVLRRAAALLALLLIGSLLLGPLASAASSPDRPLYDQLPMAPGDEDEQGLPGLGVLGRPGGVVIGGNGSNAGLSPGTGNLGSAIPEVVGGVLTVPETLISDVEGVIEDKPGPDKGNDKVDQPASGGEGNSSGANDKGVLSPIALPAPLDTTKDEIGIPALGGPPKETTPATSAPKEAPAPVVQPKLESAPPARVLPGSERKDVAPVAAPAAESTVATNAATPSGPSRDATPPESASAPATAAPSPPANQPATASSGDAPPVESLPAAVASAPASSPPLDGMLGRPIRSGFLGTLPSEAQPVPAVGPRDTAPYVSGFIGGVVATDVTDTAADVAVVLHTSGFLGGSTATGAAPAQSAPPHSGFLGRAR